MMHLVGNGRALPFLIEPEAHEGVRRVARKVMEDVRKVSGVLPEMIDAPVKAPFVLCATLGCSPLADRLVAEGKLPQAENIRGKWECWLTAFVDGSLVILGSDKRGTIYGLYSLSEYIGVSPLWYWGDAEPQRREELLIEGSFLTVTKEPSVRYRGLFINDEWPCFGTWCMEHFGGVNAEMYDHVFDLLLRLKGNYMWPAMWASVFGEEGPGSANEELADLYGIVVGNSHHEPCLRAGEEFQHTIRDGAPYGNVWNFVKNREGITRFWADGLKRSGQYEHLITIGMRGEADSAMLGDDAGLRGNIEYLKDVITTQEQLIQQYAGPKSKDQPRLLALYKEVEPFFYGSDTVPGLKDWEGLRNTVCMLCEDNQGFLRSLPTPEMTESLQQRGCGWGMYYHVDYHGGPVSYEWLPSTPFSLLWEQMCLAYDAGIRDVWILNVGDLKFNEVSLKQFLDLAYDYDRWGSHHEENWSLWLEDFVSSTFPGTPEGVKALLNSLYTLNGMRRPEALNASVYHPCHYGEAHRMLARTDEVLKLCSKVMVHNRKNREAFYSLVSYPVMAGMNHIRMHLAAALNAHYAAQGRKKANDYAEMVRAALDMDRSLAEKFAAWKDGKWRGMEREEHIGFTQWNEDGCKLPLQTTVTPLPYPRLSLSRQDEPRVVGRQYGAPAVIRVHDFCDAGVDEVVLEAANDGSGSLTLLIEGEAPWLTVKIPEKEQEKSFIGGMGRRKSALLTLTVESLETIRLLCDRDLLPAEEEQQVTLVLRSEGEGSHAACTVHVDVRARKHPKNASPAFMPVNHVVAIEAHHFVARHDTANEAFRVLPGLGRSGHAVKVYPNMQSFQPGEDAPSLTYRFLAEAAGEYTCELWLTPTSPVRPGVPMCCLLTGPEGDAQLVTCVPADYRPGENSDPRWCAAMVDHIRKVPVSIRCREGLNEITLAAVDPNLSLERLLVYPAGHKLPASYLGPAESALL